MTAGGLRDVVMSRRVVAGPDLIKADVAYQFVHEDGDG